MADATRQTGSVLSERAVIERTKRGTVLLRFTVAASRGFTVPYSYEIDNLGRYRSLNPTERPFGRRRSKLALRRERRADEHWTRPITDEDLAEVRRSA
jgi:hypothetical protein